MKINSIKSRYNCQNQSKNNFKAREFATVKTVLKDGVQSLKIYEVNEDDTKFLDVMSQKINLKKLIDIKATPKQLLQWKNIINNAIMMTNFNEPQCSFLMTKNNRPCALLTFKDIQTDSYVDYLASWPIAPHEKVKLAGTTMLKTLFEHAEIKNTQRISLSTAANSLVDLVKYYEKMNFVKNHSNNIYEPDMIVTRDKFLEKSKELDEIIKVSFVKNPETVNLKNVLDLKYQ